MKTLAPKSLAQIVKFIFVMMIAISFAAPSVSLAQNNDAGTTSTRGGPRRQLATILFAGLGGAVLGLSTLSFYGRPQDHLANIALGFAGGVIIGTSVVTYRAATNPSEFYGTRPQFESEQAFTQRAAFSPRKSPTFALNFDF